MHLYTLFPEGIPQFMKHKRNRKQAENGSFTELKSQRCLELSKQLKFEEEKSWKKQNHRGGSPKICNITPQQDDIQEHNGKQELEG